MRFPYYTYIALTPQQKAKSSYISSDTLLFDVPAECLLKSAAAWAAYDYKQFRKKILWEISLQDFFMSLRNQQHIAVSLTLQLDEGYNTVEGR